MQQKEILLVRVKAITVYLILLLFSSAYVLYIAELIERVYRLFYGNGCDPHVKMVK